MSERKAVLDKALWRMAISVRKAKQFGRDYPITPEERAKLGPLGPEKRGGWRRPVKHEKYEPLSGDVRAEGGTLRRTPTLVSE